MNEIPALSHDAIQVGTIYIGTANGEGPWTELKALRMSPIEAEWVKTDESYFSWDVEPWKFEPVEMHFNVSPCWYAKQHPLLEVLGIETCTPCCTHPYSPIIFTTDTDDLTLIHREEPAWKTTRDPNSLGSTSIG